MGTSPDLGNFMTADTSMAFTVNRPARHSLNI